MAQAQATRESRELTEGWPLVGIASVALLAMTGAVLAAEGTGEAGWRMLIRATARSSPERTRRQDSSRRAASA